MIISIRKLDTPIGTLVLAAGKYGVTGIELDRGEPGQTRDELCKRLAKRFGDELKLVEDTEALADVTGWLKSYYNNPMKAGPYSGPLDPGGTDFQRAVWDQLVKIPLGKVATYGEVASAIGNPGAVRAVGSACGANPIPIVVPCHRVVASGGPGGFGRGLELKRKMLASEGFLLL